MGDGTRLRAILTGLAGSARTPGNIRLLNNSVVEGAVRAEAETWHGTVHFDGRTAQGDISLVSRNMIVANGCRLGMCKTLQFQGISGEPQLFAKA